MNFSLTGHHLDITPAIRDYVMAKLERVTRHFDDVIDVNVVMSVEKLRHKVEVNLHARGKDIHVEAIEPDMYAAIDMLADKLDLCLEHFITPIFCCGEPLAIREAGTQNEYVAIQLKESLFHLSKDKIKDIVIAYEPIWAIGTGKTATTEQAQEMHAYLRTVLKGQYGSETAEHISILYGGSVKANNAKELFACPDVDGGLVGGASLVASDFIEIIKALK